MAIDNSLAMRLRCAYMTMHRFAQSHFAPFGVTADQYVLMSLLAEQDGVRQQELAERACSDPNTIGAMLTLLEKKKLLLRKSDVHDGRARLVCLTAKGRRFQKQLMASIEPLHVAMEKSIGSRRQALVKCLLDIESAAESRQREPLAG